MRDLTRRLERMEEGLTPHERFRLAISAMSRRDEAELDRLNNQAPYRAIREQEPAYFGRVQRFISLAFEHGLRVERQKLIAMTAIATLTALDESRPANVGTSEKLDDVLDMVMPRIRALEKAWDDFCKGIGLTPTDLRSALELCSDFADELLSKLGECEPDESAYTCWLDYLRSRWERSVTDHFRGIESFDKPTRRQ